MSIVAGTKFITYNPNLDLKERRSKGPNSETRVYTIEDIVTAATPFPQDLQTTLLNGNNSGTNSIVLGLSRALNYTNGLGGSLESLFTTVNREWNLPDATGTIALTNTLSTEMSYAASDATTPLTVSDAGVMFATHDMTIQSVFGAIGIVGGTSGVTTIDIKKNGVSILSTLITVDFGEATSLTAAVQPVVSVSSILKGDKISANITTISGDGTEAGLQITLNGLRV